MKSSSSCSHHRAPSMSRIRQGQQDALLIVREAIEFQPALLSPPLGVELGNASRTRQGWRLGLQARSGPRSKC